jgi:predicted nucleotidyltransferase
MEDLPRDFREFLSLLNSHGVDYLLVGGHAVAFHGYPRYTGDLDVWIAVDRENASRLVDALREFGFDVPELSSNLFLDQARMTTLGREPVKIEILNSVSGLEFRPARERAIVVDLGGLRVPFISLVDLKTNKKASGRLKDQLDLENLPDPD